MSNLDGSERQILIEVPQTGFIDDMKVFMATGELCYADGPRKKIQCIDTRSKRIRSIINSPNITFPLLSVGDEQLFWMQRGSNTIESSDQYSVRQKPIYYNMSWVYNLEAVTNVCPMFHSECAINNGGCQKDTICLLSPRDPSGKTCKQVSTYRYD
ncbi:AGAP008193-PA-like protein [Anopheles sinensis]|uniref:AGAP008193-PA-like protein n=1 Tax=Anopheles sinensis TaxID=74873 RepID=A0A084VL99_ANOSI|nr:AGAP008193-PA-like protein [Anopheles sinensis]